MCLNNLYSVNNQIYIVNISESYAHVLERDFYSYFPNSSKLIILLTVFLKKRTSFKLLNIDNTQYTEMEGSLDWIFILNFILE